jgi:hypothetical protein
VTIFIIYKRPEGLPEGYVVKRWVVDQDGAQPDLIQAEADTLELARTFIPEGMFRFSRERDDPDDICESWI